MPNKPNLIFITGGVVSSLGKGIATASLAALLQTRGYTVRIRKLDPYLNVDSGTMSPYQHGEVFVTEDGAETDLDLGHYERFTNINTCGSDSITGGKIYTELLKRERRGDYLGATIQVIPHITNLIAEFIFADLNDVDFLLCEIGGTIGDIEGLPYFEAIRQIGYKHNNAIYIHLTLVPYLNTTKELKTKPTQHSVRELRSIGIQPHIILCRSEIKIPELDLAKIGLFCSVPAESVIEALDTTNIYKAPLQYYEAGLDTAVLEHFGINPAPSSIQMWKDIAERIDQCQNSTQIVTIGIVGKYNSLQDAYKSITEALIHAGIYHICQVNIRWVNAEDIPKERDSIAQLLKDVDGILIPGGFGERGVQGKMAIIQFCRENGLPFFGVCLGMQLAAVEYAKNVIGIEDAHSSEFLEGCTPIIDLIEESENYGGTMKRGKFDCLIKDHSLAHRAYGMSKKTNFVSERHRHRYEFRIEYKEIFEKHGICFSGISKDQSSVEILELPEHPYFIGVQFHPELQSRPFAPHPLFVSFIGTLLAINHNNGRGGKNSS